jgi:hypothetical protein
MRRLMPILGAISAVTAAHAQPLVTFAPVPGQQLIAVNNPEQLFTVDLGDDNLGNTVIYRDQVRPGIYRNWFQHSNKSGGTIGYAIAVENPGLTTISVASSGRGFTATLNGGTPFVGLFNTPTRSQMMVPPGQRVWFWRNDSAVPNGPSFSGVIDLVIKGGDAIIENVAYRSFARLTGVRSYQGYVVRTEPNGQNTARVYKGRSPVSTIETNLSFTIGNGTPVGPLSVQTRDYNLVSQVYGAPVTRGYWISNIGPAQNAQGVSSDMLTFTTPGWGPISIFTRSDATNNFPNFGNWGAMYRVNLSVTNTGTTARTVTYNLQPPGNAPVAYRYAGGWKQTIIGTNVSFPIYSVSVPAGQTVVIPSEWALGGPGFGAIRNTVNVTNAGP